MAKFMGLFPTIRRAFIIASGLAMAVALPLWSSSGVAQNDTRTSTEDGGDTYVTRTYDDKTGKLLEVVRHTETLDPNDRTKIQRKVTTKKYDQGKRPHYETTVDEQEIVLDGRKQVVRKRTTSTTTYTKNKQRELVIEVEEEKELVGFEANGKPIYIGTRVTARGKGIMPVENEVWDAKNRKWVFVGSTLNKFLEAKRQKLLEAQLLKRSNRRSATKEKLTAPQDNRISDNSNNKGTHYAVDDELNRTEVIPDRDEKSIPNCQPPAKGGAGKSGCSAMVLPFNRDACLAYQQHQTDVCAGITDPWQAPIQQECWKLLKSGLANLQTRNTECGCDRRCHEALAKDLRATLKILKISLAEAKEEKNCKSGGGLVGAVDCVDRRIEGAGSESKKTPASAASTDERTGVKTTSVRNPDGTRTVTKTDKDGNVLSEEIVGKSPTSASSTNNETGITTTSVRNPDGTRTVTKTDKDGNILSKEIVGKSPASASSTVNKTGITTTSVQNPDGTHTVTKTDKQGNILSRETVQ